MWPSPRFVLTLWLLACAACSVYDDDLTYANPVVDSGGGGTDSCVASTEQCNGRDDDCDGDIDEEAAAELDCSARIQHQPSICHEGFCIRSGSCDEGFFNCDGRPENGCESDCPCEGCSDTDAGPDGG